MSKVIRRVEQLIQLAGSSNENEARNAAVMACKLIRDGGLVISEKAFVKTPFVAPPRPRPEAPKPPSRSPYVVIDDDSPIVIRSKLNGPCLDCGEAYGSGDMVWWKPGVGCVHHMKCDPARLTRKE
jgi:hypothetical protein